MNFIFTYGANHFDAAGRSLGQCFTSIDARNGDEAKAIMMLCRGRKWSHQYTSPEAAGVERFGLAEVGLGQIFLNEDDAPRGFDSVLFHRGSDDE